MARVDVYQQLAMPDGVKGQIRGFTRASTTRIYQAEIRRQATQYGYADRTVKVTDPAVLQALDDHAAQIAESIPKTYNRMLQNQIDALPDGLSDEEIRTRLQPFLDSVRAYNAETLVPYSSRLARSAAVSDFHGRNGIESTWELQPTTTHGAADVCDEALSLGVMSQQQADGYSFPAHQNCPHLLVPVEVVKDTLPAEGDLWTGEGE